MTDPLILENRHTGERLVLRRVVDVSGVEAIEIEGSLPPGGVGPPPHAHPLQAEEGVVLTGVLGARVDGETRMVRAGEPLHFPAGCVHTWWNAADVPLEFRGRITPALHFDRILERAFAVVNRSRTGRPSVFEMAPLLRRYRDEYRLAVIPDPVQRILFPLVEMLGRVLGRYAGRAAEGESAAGAPSRPEAPGREPAAHDPS